MTARISPGLRWRDGLITAADQAWLSLLNLTISLAFVRCAAKEDFGLYLVLLTPITLLQGVQGALVLSPLATLLPAAPEADRPGLRKYAVDAQIVLLVAAASVSALGLIAVDMGGGGTPRWFLALAFALATGGVCTREGLRALHYASHQPRSALRSDLAYGAGVLVGTSLLAVAGMVTTTWMLLLIGCSALWPLVLKVRDIGRWSLDRQVASNFWDCGKWALAGAVLTWVNLNMYPWIVGYRLGLDAVADINAARLLLVPAGLLITAWSNLYRPRISAWNAAGDLSAIRRLSEQWVAAGVVGMGVVALIVWIGYPMFDAILGSRYAGLRPLALLWALFFTLTGIRTVLMAASMVDPQGYRSLMQVSAWALGLSVPGLWLAAPYGEPWVVTLLCGVEALQLILVARAFSRRLRNAA